MNSHLAFQHPGIITIVDDNETNLDILIEALSDDYEVRVAVDGETALEDILRDPPDLILLDIMLPGLDGFDVCRRLKENAHTRYIPVIFITAMTDQKNEAKGLEIGAIDYITKPFSPPIVRARVKNHLELKRRGDLLETLASIDSLTGIPNRRYFEQTFTTEWRRATRTNRPLSLIMIDIDHFKSYNDNYGHAAGDECLRQVASTLANANLRAEDLVARYGGEEFICLLPQTSFEGAFTVAERMHTQILALRVPLLSSHMTTQVTVSMGVATECPHYNQQPSDLLEQADKALYRAKAQGRNQIEGTKSC